MEFTCSERPGKNNLKELIADLMVDYVNEKMGYKAVKVKEDVDTKGKEKKGQEPPKSA